MKSELEEALMKSWDGYYLLVMESKRENHLDAIGEMNPGQVALVAAILTLADTLVALDARKR